jgi:hypothetical protein
MAWMGVANVNQRRLLRGSYLSDIWTAPHSATKHRLFLVCAVYLSLLVFGAISTRSQTVVTFDDLPVNGTGRVPLFYQGLEWQQFDYVNAVLNTNVTGGVNGYYFGMVSASNVAFNSMGTSGLISSPNLATTFDFLSVYLTGAWNSNLNILIFGYNNSTELYNTTVVVSATSPTLFTFDYRNINRLIFNTAGGQPAGFSSGSGFEFAMDNFTYVLVPEPSSLLLTVLGFATLWAFLGHGRHTG